MYKLKQEACPDISGCDLHMTRGDVLHNNQQTCVEAHSLPAAHGMLVIERVHDTRASITDWPQSVPLLPQLFR
jgi:hypothetical protein